jgi:UDP-glucose 4-epimerase
VPDLVQKVLKGQNPLHILGHGNQVRHYTYAGDLARGIRLCMEHPAALNEDFNLSTPVATSVLELAQVIWKRIRGGEPLKYVCDPSYPHDVQYRSPDVSKAAALLGFQATTTLDEMLDEVVPWIERAVREGQI